MQNLFPKNKESRTISLNSQYIVVFKNPRDVSQMNTLAKQMYPGRVKFVQEAFADATSTPYGYILVDLKQDTPEDLRLRCSVCIHVKSMNSRAHCVTPHSTISLRVTCLYWYNAVLRKAQSLKAVLVGELCEATYDLLDAAAPLTHRQQQYMRMYTAHLLSRIKRVTSECDNHSRFVWPREGISSLLVEYHTSISQQCMRLLKFELKRRRCLKFILVGQLSGSVRTVGGDRPTIAWTATVYAQIHDQPEVVYKKGDASGRQSVERCLVA